MCHSCGTDDDSYDEILDGCASCFHCGSMHSAIIEGREYTESLHIENSVTSFLKTYRMFWF